MLLTLALFYGVYNRHEPFELNAVCAIVFTAIYLVVYLLIPPTLEVRSMRLGLLFGYVPLVSLAVILFPSSTPVHQRQSHDFSAGLAWSLCFLSWEL